MREYQRRTTTKGQATIPVEIRKLLGVAPRDKVAFVVKDGGEVVIERARSVIERTAGVFKWDGPVYSAEELREMAEIAIAEDAMARLED